MEVEVQVQKLSPKAIKVAEGLMAKLTEVERGYMEDFMLGLSARQSAVKHGVKTHTVYVQRSTLRRKLEILIHPNEVYIRIPKPATPGWVKTSDLAERMKVPRKTLLFWVDRERTREGGPRLPLPASPNGRLRWTPEQAEIWLQYARDRENAMTTAEVAGLLGWQPERLNSFREGRKALYADYYNEWHPKEVPRLIDALAVAGILTTDEAQAAKAKLEERKDGKA